MGGRRRKVTQVSFGQQSHTGPRETRTYFCTYLQRSSALSRQGPIPRWETGFLVHFQWNHYYVLLFPYLLSSEKNGVAKNKRTRLLFFKFPTEAVTMGSLTWEMFLGLFQIILRRLALSENEHSAFGLTFESHL